MSWLRFQSVAVCCAVLCFAGCGDEAGQQADAATAGDEARGAAALQEFDAALIALRTEVKPEPDEAEGALETGAVDEGLVESPPAAAIAPVPVSDPALEREVALLRGRMDHLEETLDVILDEYVVGLRDENDALRREVLRLHALRSMGAEGAVPRIPSPGSDIIERLLAEEGMVAVGEEPEEDTAIALASVGGLDYAVVREWGRTPEEAAQLGEGTVSLKGMVCAVPEGSSEGELAAFGRWMRNANGIYDNINIEVFDDVEAARRFAVENVASPEHRVLSVSRHKATDRDVILIMLGGHTQEIPYDG
jgi:hypothetical protein